MAAWKSASQPDPPSFDSTDHGWSHDESTATLDSKALSPDVVIASPKVLKLLQCAVQPIINPCDSQRCGYHTGHLPCTFFCACHAESYCQIPFNKEKKWNQPMRMRTFQVRKKKIT